MVCFHLACSDFFSFRHRLVFLAVLVGGGEGARSVRFAAPHPAAIAMKEGKWGLLGHRLSEMHRR